MNTLRFTGTTRKFAWIAIVVLAGALEGCASQGKCVEWRQQQYQHEVCERYSNTGWCAYRRSETRTRDVCVKYEETKK
jgi:hypothetical protein